MRSLGGVGNVPSADRVFCDLLMPGFTFKSSSFSGSTITIEGFLPAAAGGSTGKGPDRVDLEDNAGFGADDGSIGGEAGASFATGTEIEETGG